MGVVIEYGTQRHVLVKGGMKILCKTGYFMLILVS